MRTSFLRRAFAVVLAAAAFASCGKKEFTVTMGSAHQFRGDYKNFVLSGEFLAESGSTACVAFHDDGTGSGYQVLLHGGPIDGTIKFWDRYSKVIEEREKLGFKTIVKGIANDVTVNTAEFKDFNADGGVKDNLPFEVLDVYVRHRAEFGRYSTTDQKDDKQLYDVFDKLTETITSYIE